MRNGGNGSRVADVASCNCGNESRFNRKINWYRSWPFPWGDIIKFFFLHIYSDPLFLSFPRLIIRFNGLSTRPNRDQQRNQLKKYHAETFSSRFASIRYRFDLQEWSWIIRLYTKNSSVHLSNFECSFLLINRIDFNEVATIVEIILSLIVLSFFLFTYYRAHVSIYKFRNWEI